ncbi:hypothetical protein HK104_008127, partial [Borealophlyctis nickersoniae]
MYRHLSQSRTHAFFAGLYEAYGPIVGITVLGTRVVVVADAGVARRVLTRGEEFARGDHIQAFAKGLYKHSLFLLPSGDEWKRHRRLVTSGLGPAHLRRTREVAAQCVEELGRVWRDAAGDGKELVVDMHQALTCLTLDIISAVAFSYSSGAVLSLSTPTPSPSLAAFSLFQDACVRRSALPEFAWDWLGVGPRSVENSKKCLDGVVKQILEKRAREGCEEGDLLDRLMKGVGAEEGLSEEELGDEIKGFLFAG